MIPSAVPSQRKEPWPQSPRARRADVERWIARLRARPVVDRLSDREAASLGLRRDADGRLRGGLS